MLIGSGMPLVSAPIMNAVTAMSSMPARPAHCGSNRSDHESGGVVTTSALYTMPDVPASTGTM